MFPILQLGPLAVQVPGLLLLAGVWFGTSLIERSPARGKLSAAALANVVFYALIAGIVGARLGYALRFLDVYWENPLDLVALNPNTLSTLDGLVVAALAALVYGTRAKLPFWATLDALTPGLALFAVALAAAHLASGDAFGAPTSLPWAIPLWGEERHPSQLYEIALAAGILAAVWRASDRIPYPGFLALAWVALTAAARLFLEAFRGDSLIVLGTLRAAQLVSLAVLLAALAGLHVLARKAQPEAAEG